MQVVIGKDIRLHPVGTKAKGWGWEPDTRAAIEWLEANVEPGMTVADIGTGTGILALVAWRLGAVVTAYESKPSVRDIAEANFDLNDTPVFLYGEYDGAQGFDLVVANLGDVDYSDIMLAGNGVWTTPRPGVKALVSGREPPDWVAVWDEQFPDQPSWTNPWINEKARARRFFDG